MKLSPNTLVATLLLSIPFNFILIEGIGNLYLSIVVILINFFGLFLFTKGKIILNQEVLFALFVFLITLIVTVLNVIYSDQDLIKSQITNTVIYFQIVLVFILAMYFYTRINYNYFIELFLVIVFFAVLRVIIEEPNHILMLSTKREERIEALFIGGVNNFAMILGMAFVISFFSIKKKLKRIVFCLFFMTMIVLTMSRGALLGVILTLFITSFYDVDRKTFKQLIKYTLYSLIIGFMFLLATDNMNMLIDKIEDRFFSYFTGKKSTNDFFSGRGDLITDVFNRLNDSSVFQILFGHGNGGIDFYDSVSNQHFETSHNILIDILYKNGIILLGIYILLFIYILLLFLKKRNKEKLVLFGVFVFFHLELMVNPILFAAQTGWIYAVFMVYFLKQNEFFIKMKYQY